MPACADVLFFMAHLAMLTVMFQVIVTVQVQTVMVNMENMFNMFLKGNIGVCTVLVINHSQQKASFSLCVLTYVSLVG